VTDNPFKRADAPRGGGENMNITLNGASHATPDDLTLAELVAQLELSAERVAMELNGEIIPRAQWRDTPLREGDRIELVHFVGGGEATH
jgi:thiamine biosynthesis protein ThiS